MPRTALRDLEPGAVFAGKYRVDRILASGGQGTVAAATHLRLQQPVALKVAHVSQLNGESIERLFREARATFLLTSEHIARIVDVDVDDGVPFIVMEYLEGRDLKALLAERRPFSCADAVGLLVHAIDGIAEAHDAGIIHRDLKPSNLFVQQRADGTPLLKVLDFGVSKATSPASLAEDFADLTAPLRMLGTPRYMAPEQARDARSVSVASDIWALGLILQEMLTASPAFRAHNDVGARAQIRDKSPTPVSLIRHDVPPEIERILLRCLQEAPEHRFADVRELAEQLAPFVPSWASVELARLRRGGRPRQRAEESGPGAQTPAPGIVARRSGRPMGRIALGAVPFLGLAGAATLLVATLLHPMPRVAVSDLDARAPSVEPNPSWVPLVQTLVLPPPNAEATRSERQALAQASKNMTSVHSTSSRSASGRSASSHSTSSHSASSFVAPRSRKETVPPARRVALPGTERGASEGSLVAAHQEAAPSLIFDPLDSRK